MGLFCIASNKLKGNDKTMGNPKNLAEFEELFFKNMRGLSGSDEVIRKRIDNYYELIVLRDKANPYAPNKESLRRIAIVLTTYCNLTCVWCHREEEHVKDAGYLSKHMDFNKLKKLLPELKGFDVLAWGGLGEPMLYERFYEATKLARQYIPIVKTTCNGTTLTEANIKKIAASGLNFLEVSIDGFDGEANYKLRGAHEDKIIDSLITFSEITDIPLQINTVVSEENYDSLWDAIKGLKDVKNIKMMHTIPLFMTEHMEKLGVKSLSMDKYTRLLQHWAKEIENYNLEWELSPDVVQISLDPVIFMKEKHNICFTPFEDPTINVDGEIVPCSRLQHLGLGNVFDEGFDNVWNGKKMVSFRQEQLKGNYGNLCQRECSMKVTSTESEEDRLEKLQAIHKEIKT